MYLPLDVSRNEIRMLKLSPSMRNTIIRGTLIHVDLDNLDDAPFAFYEALSYAWGDANDTVRCKINRVDRYITRNLDAALRTLRAPVRPRYIWVDAVCINQADTVERAQQIRLMRRIFQDAVQVCVWLGAPDFDTVTAIKILDYMTDYDTPDDFVEKTISNYEWLDRWKAVARFFDKPWFYRVWVRQEVACAKEVVVMCGKRHDLKIKWSTLILAADMISVHISDYWLIARARSLQGTRVHQTNALQHAILIDSFREQIQQGEEVDLAVLLGDGRSAMATDPRDRVYGLIGLAGTQAETIDISYDKSTQDVFKCATVSLLRQKQSLDPLSMCHWSEENAFYPTWCLNLEIDPRERVLRYCEGSEDWYCAAGNIPAAFSFEADGEELIADGYIFDAVCEIEHVYHDVSHDPIKATFDNWLSVAIRAANRRERKISDSDIMKSFCRMLITDQNLQLRRADPSFYEQYAACEDITAFPQYLTDIFDNEEQASRYTTQVEVACEWRRMIGTTSGYFGIAGEGCRPGDLVCILFGAGVPFILRPIEDKYILIGEAYIHGIMDGEATAELQANGTAVTAFTIR